MSWYLRSLADYDTHRGEITADGQVTATCGAVFTPYLLPQGGIKLPGYPQDPDQICPTCRDAHRDNGKS